MNKKRKFERTAAILSIVVGFMTTFFYSIILFLGVMIGSIFGGGLSPLGILFLSICIIVTLTAIATIVIGNLLCIKTNSGGTIRNTKPLVITLLVFASILILLSVTVICLICTNNSNNGFINPATITIFTYIAVTCIIAITVIINAAVSLATKNDIDQRNNSMNN